MGGGEGLNESVVQRAGGRVEEWSIDSYTARARRRSPHAPHRSNQQRLQWNMSAWHATLHTQHQANSVCLYGARE